MLPALQRYKAVESTPSMPKYSEPVRTNLCLVDSALAQMKIVRSKGRVRIGESAGGPGWSNRSAANRAQALTHMASVLDCARGKQLRDYPVVALSVPLREQLDAAANPFLALGVDPFASPRSRAAAARFPIPPFRSPQSGGIRVDAAAVGAGPAGPPSPQDWNLLDAPADFEADVATSVAAGTGLPAVGHSVPASVPAGAPSVPELTQSAAARGIFAGSADPAPAAALALLDGMGALGPTQPGPPAPLMQSGGITLVAGLPQLAPEEPLAVPGGLARVLLREPPERGPSAPLLVPRSANIGRADSAALLVYRGGRAYTDTDPLPAVSPRFAAAPAQSPIPRLIGRFHAADPEGVSANLADAVVADRSVFLSGETEGLSIIAALVPLYYL